MQVANVNMAKTYSRCPRGLEPITRSIKKLCRRNVDIGCSSTIFSTHGIPFSKVCGRVIGYQFSHVNAFYPYYNQAQSRNQDQGGDRDQGRDGNQDNIIDSLYVDGVSITYGSHPRQHIWTFAAAKNEIPSDNMYGCPCVNSLSHVGFTGLIPEFISNDYYCETGSRTSYAKRVYVDDPLWDGKRCGNTSTCCEGERKPWFVKYFAQPVTSDIEVRVCADEARSNEDILIEVISIFVQ